MYQWSKILQYISRRPHDVYSAKILPINRMVQQHHQLRTQLMLYILQEKYNLLQHHLLIPLQILIDNLNVIISLTLTMTVSSRVTHIIKRPFFFHIYHKMDRKIKFQQIVQQIQYCPDILRASLIRHDTLMLDEQKGFSYLAISAISASLNSHSIPAVHIKQMSVDSRALPSPSTTRTTTMTELLINSIRNDIIVIYSPAATTRTTRSAEIIFNNTTNEKTVIYSSQQQLQYVIYSHNINLQTN